jgi:arylsulfatase A-like enzyme
VYYLAGLYAIASIPMFRLMKVPLTLPLLSFSGGPLLMASSIRQLVPLWFMVLSLALPVALLGLGLLSRQTRARLPWLSRPRTAATACLAVFAFGGVCHGYVIQEWTDPNRWERRIAQSPHAALLASCVEQCLKDRPLTLSAAFPDADESDFKAEADDHRFCNSVPPRPSRPKNIVLIVLESTGVEYLGLYGSRFPTTPNLDRLAAERGLVFDNLYVQTPNSCKSLVSLTAAVYPRHDWRLIVRDCPDFNVPTMAQVLVERGFRTCFLHSGYWSWKGRDRYLAQRGAQTLVDASDLSHESVSSWGVSDRAMYQAALDWIDRGPRDQPFYVFAYTIETHHPYVAPESRYDFGVDDEELDRYLNAVRAADVHIAWVLDELQRRGLEDDTLVAITSDHGESFGQHGQRVHSFGLYEQDVHVPLVFLHPSLKGGPRRVDMLGQHIDLPPTLLGMMDIAPPLQWQGRDLLAAPPRERVYFFSCGNEVVLGLREGSYKYHYYLSSSRQELFDLQADSRELDNLAQQQPERCDRYRRRVGGLVEYQRRFLAGHGAP